MQKNLCDLANAFELSFQILFNPETAKFLLFILGQYAV